MYTLATPILLPLDAVTDNALLLSYKLIVLDDDNAICGVP